MSESSLQQRNHLIHKEFNVHNFQSLDYDQGENEVSFLISQYEALRKRGKLHISKDGKRWIVCGLIGLVTGLLAVAVHYGSIKVSEARFNMAEDYIQKGEVLSGYFFFFGTALVLILLNAFLVYLWPAAGGGGLAEVKAYLNGIRLPNSMNIRTLFTKVIGVTCSVASGLAVGPEGPMIHTGVMVAAGISQGRSKTIGVDTGLFKTFRNDYDKRDFMASGAAAGISAAFGAPVGGVLFSLEEMASFWSKQVTWRTFFTTMIATFTVNFFYTNLTGDFHNKSLLTFEVDTEGSGWYIWELFPFLIVGVVGGLLGALFAQINRRLNRWRIQFLNKRKFLRLLEVVVITFATTTTFFFLPFVSSCRDGSWLIVKNEELLLETRDVVEFDCKEDKHYNDLATIMFAPGESAVKHLFSRSTANEFSLLSLAIFTVCYFFFACWTSGAGISTGIFVPVMTIGAGFGRFFGEVLNNMFPSLDPGVYALIGATSMLGGVTRMTISLTIIMLEITNDIQFLLPIMLVLMVAKAVGDLLSHPLYDMMMQEKHMSYLESDLPPNLDHITVAHVMACPVVTLPPSPSIQMVLQTLSAHGHQGFPVIDASSGVFLGLIRRTQLLNILKYHEVMGPGYQLSLSELNFRIKPKMEEQIVSLFSGGNTIVEDIVDLIPYMDRACLTVQAHWSLMRAHRIFRTMGLRHMVVTDERNTVVGIVTRHNLDEHTCHQFAHHSVAADPDIDYDIEREYTNKLTLLHHYSPPSPSDPLIAETSRPGADNSVHSVNTLE
eukprot:GCRY01002527.1.p1 GENE.GCRY01002527.1~~GCRY01002527.1.p1  ORF type:complete len:776 (+),score=132.87 GCRY01002527.1:113-2440(+)